MWGWLHPPSLKIIRLPISDSFIVFVSKAHFLWRFDTMAHVRVSDFKRGCILLVSCCIGACLSANGWQFSSSSLADTITCSVATFYEPRNSFCKLDCVTSENWCFVGNNGEQNFYLECMSYKYILQQPYAVCPNPDTDHTHDCIRNTNWQCATFVCYSMPTCAGGPVCQNPVYIYGPNAATVGCDDEL
jgi:hypothetical protein